MRNTQPHTPLASDWGLYVHIPYCRMKCYYCDFNVYASGPPGETSNRVTRRRLASYLPAVAGEGLLYQDIIGQRRSFQSAYVGGGTPSLLNPGELFHLWSGLMEVVDLESGAELTFECNPDDMQVDLLQALQSIGVSRLSVGLQALQTPLLRQLGRVHTVEDFVRAYRRASETGFKNINVDIMFGLPGQTVADLEATLALVLSLQPKHVSAYGLQVEEGTAFGLWHQKGLLERLTEEVELEMYMTVIDRLGAAGYHHYELSNFARPGFESRHNLGYWRLRDYLGLGAGAHSLVKGRRWSNLRYPPLYEERVHDGRRPLDKQHRLTTRDLEIEYMFMGLRCLDGIVADDFRQKFDETPERAFAPQLDHLTRLGLLEETSEGFRLTRKGIPLANVVFREFV